MKRRMDSRQSHENGKTFKTVETRLSGSPGKVKNVHGTDFHGTKFEREKEKKEIHNIPGGKRGSNLSARTAMEDLSWGKGAFSKG